MVITAQQLKEQYSKYSNPIAKINRDVKQGKLFPLVKGVYETDPNAFAPYLAQFIYGPSYISFDYILHYQGLIPEAIYHTVTCATYNKKKIKTYTNKFGTFIYRDVPSAVFSLGVLVINTGGYSYQVATPEKALCDKLYSITPIKTVRDLEVLLFEDLRIDEDKFNELNKEELLELAPLYHSTNLNLLAKFIKGEKWNATSIRSNVIKIPDK